MFGNSLARVVLGAGGMTWRSSIALACLAVAGVAAQRDQGAWTSALTSTTGLTMHGAVASVVTHKGKQAVRLVEAAGYNGEPYAIVSGPSFLDGRIEADIAGEPGAGAPDTARGFVGLAFRVQDSGFECFYIRPTNGRADDQLRRNHSTQYISFPDFPWERLRRETPGVYESYTDLVTAEWTHVRIEVHGQRAELYVGSASQPTLIVKDLKRPVGPGSVALWIGLNTVGHFRDLRVTPAAAASR